MSQYINFYFKTKDDTFISVGDFSCNTKMYEVCREVGAPWEQLEPVTEKRREQVLNGLLYRKCKVRKRISELESELKDSHIFKGLSLEDRVTWREELKFEIKQWKEKISELDYGINFITIIGEMREGHDYPHENQLYFGFEVEGAPENLKNN